MKVAVVYEGKAQIPPVYFRNLVILSTAYGIDTFLCHLADFNFKTKKVQGLFFESGRWFSKETDFPDVCDNPLVTKKNASVLVKLSRSMVLMNHRIGAKAKSYPVLAQDPAFRPYYIQTANLKTNQQLFEFLANYQTVILKPGDGRMARGIVKITQAVDNFKLLTLEGEMMLTKDELTTYSTAHFINDNFIIQRYIETTLDGHPFHCRMLVRPNELGEFTLVKDYVEIGIGSRLVSNMHVGGGMIWLKSLLEIKYGTKSESIAAELRRMSKELPAAFQRHYDYNLSALGIDIALDQEGHPWVMEVNAGPGHEYVKLEDVEARIKNYYYLCTQAQAARKFSRPSFFVTAGDIKRYL